MMDNKIKIIRENGEFAEATTPVIVSASRSTDIPAFYSKWFMNRLEKGYCIWYNPFNRKPMFISFKNTKVIVFWTKNPEPMIKYLPELDRRGIHYYFQITLNDYDKEGFEPNVPNLISRIETFKHLSNIIGSKKVIWRFDPLILTEELTPRKLLTRIYHIGNQIKGYTDKLVFSFVDVKVYRKVQNNLIKETPFFTKENIDLAEPEGEKRKELVEGLVKLREHWRKEGWNLELATCSEDVDLEKYSISHNSCIDGDLMERLFYEDNELLYYLKSGKLPQPDIFGNVPELAIKRRNLKDKGQRKACGCIVSKDIGMYNTCKHLCVYCYANTSRECVLNNVRKYDDNGESIIG